MITLGEVTRFDYPQWHNLSRWIATMKARPNWAACTRRSTPYFVAAYQDAEFVAL